MQDPSWEKSPLPEFQQSPWPILALHQPRDFWLFYVEPMPQVSTRDCQTCVGNPCPAMGTLLC